MGTRIKKYRMKAIPSAFSEKGGFSAQFIGDGYSVDARTEILPSVITASGVQVGEGTAWELVTAFLKACAQRAANTGETVNVGSLVTFGLAIKGWYSNKDSKAAKDSVRVTATLLGDLKPTVAFSMSNALEGATLVLVTVMSDGCALGHVRQGAAFRINGKELVMLEGDTVTATLKTEGGETVTALCPITGSASDHIDATLPAVFSDAAFAGREVRFTVRGRCGDPEACVQEKDISAVLDAAETPPVPSNPPRIVSGHSESHADDGKCYADGSGFVLEGDNLEDATVTVAGSANGGETWSYEETVPADKVNFDADMLTIDGNWLDAWNNHLDIGELVKFTVETTQGEDSITRTLSA
jgi:hypothetical protein